VGGRGGVSFASAFGGRSAGAVADPVHLVHLGSSGDPEARAIFSAHRRGGAGGGHARGAARGGAFDDGALARSGPRAPGGRGALARFARSRAGPSRRVRHLARECYPSRAFVVKKDGMIRVATRSGRAGTLAEAPRRAAGFAERSGAATATRKVRDVAAMLGRRACVADMRARGAPVAGRGGSKKTSRERNRRSPVTSPFA